MDAVITGDIIGYTKLDRRDREKLLNHLLDFFANLGKVIPNVKTRFELVRGDSFQGVASAAEGLRIALLIKCFLNSYVLSETEQPTRRRAVGKVAADARIAIGFGNIDFNRSRLSESDGEAFWLSGRSLDELKSKNHSLRVVSSSSSFNEELTVQCLLLEAIMRKWSVAQAQVISEKLKGYKDYEIAEMLGKSRQAISLRASDASWLAVEALLDRVAYLVTFTLPA